MKDLVKLIAEFLVDEPDEVSVEEVESNNLCILQLNVAPNDIGKVIGKKGRIASAIRTILNASASKMDKHVLLEIVEPK
jgi:predicted RNA-binding protein YlqC (UPF0109 family)